MDHTPGPWRVTVGLQAPPCFTNFRIEEHTHTEVVTLNEDGDPVHPSQTSWTYTLDNAQLIAAAPDLLDVCKRILAPRQGDDIIALAYAAVSKAVKEPD